MIILTLGILHAIEWLYNKSYLLVTGRENRTSLFVGVARYVVFVIMFVLVWTNLQRGKAYFYPAERGGQHGLCGASMSFQGASKAHTTNVHAVLVILRYPSIDEHTRSSLQRITHEEKSFLAELKKETPLLDPVFAVTHLDACKKVKTAQECTEDFATALGITEFGNVFALDTQPAPANSSFFGPVYLSPSQLYLIVERLQHKARPYYKRMLAEDGLDVTSEC